MNGGGAMKNLLNLWVSDFMCRYVPDIEERGTARLLYEQLRSVEARHGSKLVSQPWSISEEKHALYKVGEVLADQWEVPITQIGLAGLTLGCQDANDMRMVMAVAYLRFIQMGPPADQPLDIAAVTSIFDYGTCSRDFLDQMWQTQFIPGYGALPSYNLLDRVCSQDFNNLNLKKRVSTPV